MSDFLLGSGIAPKHCARHQAQMVRLRNILEGLASEEYQQRMFALDEIADFALAFSYSEGVRFGDRRDYLSNFLIVAAKAFRKHNGYSLHLNTLSGLLRSVLGNLPRFTAGQRRRARALEHELELVEKEFLFRRLSEVAEMQEQIWTQALGSGEFETLAKSLLKAAVDELNGVLREKAFRWMAEQREKLPLSIVSLAAVRNTQTRATLGKRSADEMIWLVAAIVAAFWSEKVDLKSELAAEILRDIERFASNFPQGELTSVLASAQEFFAEC